MSQPTRPKNPLDVLQSMINAILIETGKALRGSQKEDGRPSVAVTTRLRSVMPSTTENFHSALDELECDILRAKSVLLRDYEELRAKRLALENPEPIIEKTEAEIAVDHAETNGTSTLSVSSQQDATATIKEEAKQTDNPEEHVTQAPQDPPEGITQVPDDTKAQNPTPPSSANENGANAKPIGLGIVTDGTVPAPGPETAELQNSSVDSLFDAPDDNNDTNAGDSTLDFDSMEFLQDTGTNSQGNDQSQTQNIDFDLTNFGNTSQDFNMPSLNTSTVTNNNNTNNANKQNEDSFAIGDNAGGDNMDINLGDLDMAGADESVFDDMFFDDDTNTNLGTEMEHGDFDNAFFGLE